MTKSILFGQMTAALAIGFQPSDTNTAVTTGAGQDQSSAKRLH